MSTNNRSSFKPKLVSLLVLCLMLVGAKQAYAEDVARCEVYEIAASNSGAGIDAQLKALEKKLKKPPFSAWDTFKLVKKHTANAALMKAVAVKLTGGTLGLLYKERSDSKTHKPRLRVVLTLDDATGKRKAEITLKVDSGDYSLLGQDSSKDGSSRVLAIRCSVK